MNSSQPTREALARYISENEARDKAQAERIAKLEAECGGYIIENKRLLYTGAPSPLPAAPVETARAACVIGRHCVRHGFIHGAEAEELRDRLEKASEATGHTDTRRTIRRILDKVDARDSLAWLEFKGREEADESEPPDDDPVEAVKP
jgi:hypothetical protein